MLRKLAKENVQRLLEEDVPMNDMQEDRGSSVGPEGEATKTASLVSQGLGSVSTAQNQGAASSSSANVWAWKNKDWTAEEK